METRVDQRPCPITSLIPLFPQNPVTTAELIQIMSTEKKQYLLFQITTPDQSSFSSFPLRTLRLHA